MHKKNLVIFGSNWELSYQAVEWARDLYITVKIRHLGTLSDFVFVNKNFKIQKN